jgi:hypothetical protein
MRSTFGKAVLRGSILSVVVLLMSTNMAALAKSVGLSIFTSSFPVAANPTVYEWSSSVAFDENRDQYLVVYEEDSEISAVCLNHFGTPQAYYGLGSGIYPDVVYNIRKDQYLVVWTQLSTELDVVGAFIDGDCSNEPGSIYHIPYPISGDVSDDNLMPAVAYNHHENHQDYLVVWMNWSASGDSSIYARRVTNLGLGLDSSIEIKASATADYSNPDVAYNLNMNEYLVVYEYLDSSPGATSDIYGRRVYNSGGMGVLPEEVIDSSGGDQLDPAVAVYRLNQTAPYLVVFRDFWNDTSGDIRGYLLFKNGSPHQLVNIAVQSGETESEPTIGSSELLGGYTVAWLQQNALSSELHSRHVQNTGILEPDQLVIELPVVIGQPALSNGPRIPLVTWTQHNTTTDIYGQFLWSSYVFLPLMVR